jgi:acetyl-CoA synthetase
LDDGTLVDFCQPDQSRDHCRFETLRTTAASADRQDARVNMLGVVPTIVKAWRASGLMEPFDWSAIHLSVQQARVHSATIWFICLHWPTIGRLSSIAGDRNRRGYITSTVVQPNVPQRFFASSCRGLDFVILDESQQRADEGELFIVPPSIGLSSRLLNRDHFETYYAETPAGSSSPPLRVAWRPFSSIAGPCYVAGGRVDDTHESGRDQDQLSGT